MWHLGVSARLSSGPTSYFFYLSSCLTNLTRIYGKHTLAQRGTTHATRRSPYHYHRSRRASGVCQIKWIDQISAIDDAVLIKSKLLTSMMNRIYPDILSSTSSLFFCERIRYVKLKHFGNYYSFVIEEQTKIWF